MRYWVYENYPNDKAIVHRASCSFCNRGAGIHGTGKTRNGEWHGPFDNTQQARYAAKNTQRMDIRDCAIRIP